MSPKFVPFELERWQSTWENRVRFNLSESGVHPLTIQELLGLAGASALPLLEVRLGYSQSNGTDRLRERIAALYPGASPDQVLVTTGSSEANFVTCWRLLEPGDKVAVMMPNYMQTAGLTQNFGAEVRPFQLHEKEGWEPYAEEIRTAIASGTKLVVITNPHNPTGHVLGDAARKVILERAAEVGAWILADEVYQGAELSGKTTESFWGSGYNKVVIVNGLSKAYGLPGLRIGWIVSQPGFTQEAWARHDYTTIGPSGAPDRACAVAAVAVAVGLGPAGWGGSVRPGPGGSCRSVVVSASTPVECIASRIGSGSPAGAGWPAGAGAAGVWAGWPAVTGAAAGPGAGVGVAVGVGVGAGPARPAAGGWPPATE